MTYWFDRLARASCPSYNTPLVINPAACRGFWDALCANYDASCGDGAVAVVRVFSGGPADTRVDRGALHAAVRGVLCDDAWRASVRSRYEVPKAVRDALYGFVTPRLMREWFPNSPDMAEVAPCADTDTCVSPSVHVWHHTVVGGVLVDVFTLSCAVLAILRTALLDTDEDVLANVYARLADALNGVGEMDAALEFAEASGDAGAARSIVEDMRALSCDRPTSGALEETLDVLSCAGEVLYRTPAPVPDLHAMRIRHGVAQLQVDTTRVSELMGCRLPAIMTSSDWVSVCATNVPRAATIANGCFGAALWYAASYNMTYPTPAAVGYARAVFAMLQPWHPDAPEPLPDSPEMRDHIANVAMPLLAAYATAVDTMEIGVLVAIMNPVSPIDAAHVRMRDLTTLPPHAAVEALRGVRVQCNARPLPPTSARGSPWGGRIIESNVYTTPPHAVFDAIYSIERSWRAGEDFVSVCSAPSTLPRATLSLSTCVVIDMPCAFPAAPCMLRPIRGMPAAD